MVVTDQQLRQELIKFGETVPPITQRNREQLRARLDVLRSQTRRRSSGSPARSQTSGSPSRTTRATGSPSTSRSRLAVNSPTRSRSNLTTNISASRPTTRSKNTPNLIELSDSETESSSVGVLMSRSVAAGQTAPNIQTRSIALRRQQDSPTTFSTDVEIPKIVTNDVEQSIARHRREIKQLLDSARDRNRVTTTDLTSSNSQQENQQNLTTSIHSNSKSKLFQKSDENYQNEDEQENTNEIKRSPKFENEQQKKSSSPKRSGGKSHQSCWKKLINFFKNLLKILFVTSILFAGLSYFLTKTTDFFPSQKEISCSIQNATKCEEMKSVISAVRKHLQVRAGEVECGFRSKSEVLMTRREIEKYLDEKGFKFTLGDEERWKTLIKYIFDKEIYDILVWNKTNQQTKNIDEAKKLSSTEALRSLTCRARQDVNSKTFRNLMFLLLGSIGLLTFVRFLHRKSKNHQENEKTFKDYLEKATNLLQEQYEKHIKDPQTQPWLSISYIRDKIIPEKDRERLKAIWERVKNEINKQDSRIHSKLQEIDGKTSDVWQWIKSAASSPQKPKIQQPLDLNDENDVYSTTEVGLTECLKIRNCFRSDNYADDEEIDHVVDSIQNRCVNIKRIEHIGIHSVFVYLKFSSKEAAAQGYHLLNNWKYQDRLINVKYIRLNRYYEHFPEAKNQFVN